MHTSYFYFLVLVGSMPIWRYILHNKCMFWLFFGRGSVFLKLSHFGGCTIFSIKTIITIALWIQNALVYVVIMAFSKIC